VTESFASGQEAFTQPTRAPPVVVKVCDIETLH